MDVLNFPASSDSESELAEHNSAGIVEVLTGWTQDEGKPETRENSVVLFVVSNDDEDHTFEFARHLTPEEALQLAAELTSTANFLRRSDAAREAEVPC